MRFPTGLQCAGPLLLVCLLLMPGKQAGAQSLDYALDQNSQSAAQGATVSFVALLSNTSATDQLSLDSGSATFNFTSSGLTLVDNFAATPTTLDVSGSAADSWTGTLFQVQIGPTSPAGDYSGSYEISYTNLTSGISTAHSQNFTVTVEAPTAAAPEPGALGIGVGLGGALLAGGRLFRRRSRRLRP